MCAASSTSPTTSTRDTAAPARITALCVPCCACACPKTTAPEAGAAAPVSVAQEHGHQRVWPHLPAPMPMHRRVEHRAGRQGVGRIEVLAGPEHARDPALQPDLHLALQNEHPLRLARAMEIAAKAHRAVAQLVALGAHEGAELRGRLAL